MTLRKFAKGYDGNIMLKAFEDEKSTTPTAIMMTQITDSIRMRFLTKKYTATQWFALHCLNGI